MCIQKLNLVVVIAFLGVFIANASETPQQRMARWMAAAQYQKLQGRVPQQVPAVPTWQQSQPGQLSQEQQQQWLAQQELYRQQQEQALQQQQWQALQRRQQAQQQFFVPTAQPMSTVTPQWQPQQELAREDVQKDWPVLLPEEGYTYGQGTSQPLGTYPSSTPMSETNVQKLGELAKQKLGAILQFGNAKFDGPFRDEFFNSLHAIDLGSMIDEYSSYTKRQLPLNEKFMEDFNSALSSFMEIYKISLPEKSTAAAQAAAAGTSPVFLPVAPPRGHAAAQAAAAIGQGAQQLVWTEETKALANKVEGMVKNFRKSSNFNLLMQGNIFDNLIKQYDRMVYEYQIYGRSPALESLKKIEAGLSPFLAMIKSEAPLIPARETRSSSSSSSAAQAAAAIAPAATGQLDQYYKRGVEVLAAAAAKDQKAEARKRLRDEVVEKVKAIETWLNSKNKEEKDRLEKEFKAKLANLDKDKYEQIMNNENVELTEQDGILLDKINQVFLEIITNNDILLSE